MCHFVLVSFLNIAVHTMYILLCTYRMYAYIKYTQIIIKYTNVQKHIFLFSLLYLNDCPYSYIHMYDVCVCVSKNMYTYIHTHTYVCIWMLLLVVLLDVPIYPSAGSCSIRIYVFVYLPFLIRVLVCVCVCMCVYISIICMYWYVRQFVICKNIYKTQHTH